MSENLVYVRARPSTVHFKERFHYNSEISRNPDTRQIGQPEGAITVTVPYDGERYFSRESLRDFERQVPDRSKGHGTGIQGRIGYLIIENYEDTDLDYHLDLVHNYHALPIDIPISDNLMTNDEDLISDRYIATIDHAYAPTPLEVPPISLKAWVLDEGLVSDLVDKFISVEGDQEFTLSDQVADALMTQQGFASALLLHFDVTIALPEKFKEITRNSNLMPHLRSLSLEWPFPTSQTSVDMGIFMDDADSRLSYNPSDIRQISDPAYFGGAPEQRLIYNPFKQRIEWGGAKFEKWEKPETVELYYSHLRFRYLVRQPGELYRKHALQGTLVLDLPFLLSGTRVSFFDAVGNLSDQVRVTTGTEIMVDFQLYLEDCFADKTYAPYQHIQFEGLILEEMRVADITKALQDRGFEIMKRSTRRDETDPGALRSCTIVASRPEGPNTLLVSLQAEGTVSTVERVRERYGAESFKAQVRAGHTVIYLRGELPGNGTRLNQVLNEIQLLLKERLSRHIKLD